MVDRLSIHGHRTGLRILPYGRGKRGARRARA